MKATIRIKTLKIDDIGCHLLTNVKLNSKSVRVVIDTGASHSVFDMVRIKQFLVEEKIMEADKLSSGLGTNSMKSMEVVISKFEIGKIRIENQKLVLLDLQHVIQSYESIGQKPIEGVIGSDLLKKLKAVINYGESSLTIFLPDKIRKSDKKKTKK